MSSGGKHQPDYSGKHDPTMGGKVRPAIDTYSKNRLITNAVAIFVFLFLLISFWSLRSKNSQKIFTKLFSSKLISFFSIIVFALILLSLFFYLGGYFGEKSIYYEKLSPLLLLFFLLSVEVYIYQRVTANVNPLLTLITTFSRIIDNKAFLFVGIILCIYLVTIFFSLSKGHNWGDDFAHYLLQSNSLLTGTVDSYVQGTEFTNINSSSRYSPTVLWGFPLYLLPFVKIFSQNILGLKLVNVIAYSAFLITLYKWSSIRLSKPASILVLLFFAICPTFIQFHNQVISDLFFLMCSMLSLLFLDLFISRPDKKILFGVLLGIAIFWTSFTRANGYLLLVALGFAQIVLGIKAINSKNKLEINHLFIQIVPHLVFVLCYLIQSMFLYDFPVAVQAVIERISFEIILRNIGHYFWLISGIFSDLFFPKVIYLITLPLMVLGIIDKRKSLSSWTVIVYAALTLGMYICFPGMQGIRYLFPILPIYIVYVALGLSKIISLVKTKSVGIITICFSFIFSLIFVQFGVADIKYAIRNINAEKIELIGPYSPNSAEMFDFIRHNTASNDVIVFFKPRAMRYLTGHNSIFSNTCEGLSQGDYLVWMKGEEFIGTGRQMDLIEFEKCIDSQKLVLRFENDENAIYEILKY